MSKRDSSKAQTDNHTDGTNKKQKLAPMFSKPSTKVSSSNFWRTPPTIEGGVDAELLHDGVASGVLLAVHGDPFQELVQSNKDQKSSSSSERSQSEEKGKGKEKMSGDDEVVRSWKKAKVLALDLDGTIIKPRDGKKFPSATDSTDHELVFPNHIIMKLKAAHESGHIILILSNQKQTPSSASKSKSKSQLKPSKKLETWKEKVKSLIQAWNIPLIIVGSLGDAEFRKPRIGMWELFGALVKKRMQEEGLLNEEELSQMKMENLMDMENSSFVGDAGGRLAGSFKGKERKKDWGDTDRKFALNCGLEFVEPESYFLGKEARPFELSGWKPTLNDSPLPPPVLEGEILDPSGKGAADLEVVLFVGPPCAGKSSFYRRYFEKQGYVHVNQDLLKTRDKCLALVDKSLKEGKSCVVDNTNKDEDLRDLYIQKSKPYKSSVRCIFFSTSQERAEHNSKFRAWGAGTGVPSLPLIPGVAFSSYFKGRKLPPVSEDGSAERKDGFDERTIVVGWRWDEEEEDLERKRRYLMYYS